MPRLPEASRRRPSKGDALTVRENQITSLVRTGAANKQIAYQVHLTEGTVKEYLNRIFRKLELNNRTELAVWSLTHQPEPKGQPHA
jgi:DNA-binding NarL/FixJ family response regulator